MISKAQSKLTHEFKVTLYAVLQINYKIKPIMFNGDPLWVHVKNVLLVNRC